MVTIKHILFPVDFSEQTKAVAPAVKAMAERFGAEVTLLSAMQSFWEPVGSLTALGEMAPISPLTVDVAELRRILKQRLADALVPELAGVPVGRVVELGDPAYTITQYAKSQGVDLIMMPTHGLGPFRSMLLGSVAAKVLHDAECPMWTAAHAEVIGASTRCKSVLCAVDVGSKSAQLIEWAAQFAGICGAELRFVHVVRGMGAWLERQMDREFEQTVVAQDREQLEKQIQAVNVGAPLCVAVGDVAEVVTEQALKHAADLVIIGRGMLDKSFGRLRTQAYSIIRSAPCPVLSV